MLDPFEWDASKAKSNWLKHRVTFEEAITVFEDPLALTLRDEVHSGGEERYLILGVSREGRLPVVSHTGSRGPIRVISARRATRGERRDYEEGS